MYLDREEMSAYNKYIPNVCKKEDILWRAISIRK
jgi:hypothetical protein